MRSPMSAFMSQHAVVVHPVWKLIERRHVHCLRRAGPIVGLVPTIPDLHSRPCEKLLRMGNAFMLTQLWFKSLRQLAALYLLDVENRVALGKEATGWLFPISICLPFVRAP